MSDCGRECHVVLKKGLGDPLPEVEMEGGARTVKVSGLIPLRLQDLLECRRGKSRASLLFCRIGGDLLDSSS